jgi:P27 family predicted phage terminase small subunit
VIEGNPGHQRKNRREPKPPPIAPKRPTWLDREAAAEWRRIVPILERLGLATVIDRASLAAYCQAWANYYHAQRDLSAARRANGRKRPGDRDLAQLAYTTARMYDTFRKAAAEFGLTPATRARLEVTDVPGAAAGAEPAYLD